MSRILVLEPEGEIDDGLIDAIHHAGLSTVIVDDFDTAIAAFKNEPPALVVLDLGIGDNRGLELCRAIRELSIGALVPILMVGTGEEGIDNFADALAEGGDYYFPKPLDAQKVVFKILTYVGVEPPGPDASKTPDDKANDPDDERSPKNLAGRVEQLLDLGMTFKEKRTFRSEDPGEKSKNTLQDKSVNEGSKESSEAVLSRIAGELASMRTDEETNEEDDLEKETLAWEKIERGIEDVGDGEKDQTIEEMARRDAEESAKRAVEEKAARKAAKEQARKEAEEQARKAAKEQASKEAEEQARKAAKEQARKEAEEQARKAAEEQARKEAEEKVRKEAEEQALRELEELAYEKEIQKQVDDSMLEETRVGIVPVGVRYDNDDTMMEELDEEETYQSIENTFRPEDTRVELDATISDQKPERNGRTPIKLVSLVQDQDDSDDSLKHSKAKGLKTGSRNDAKDGVGRTAASAIDTVEKAFRPPDPVRTDLGVESVPKVFWRMYEQEITGQIVFQSREITKEVFFEQGVPVGMRSTQPSDELEEVLFKEGLIDRAVYAEAKIKNIQQPRALAAHLVERGYIRSDELFPLVRRHLEDCMIGLFEWTKGTVDYQPRRAPDSEKVRLSRPMTWLVLEGIRRKFILERMVQELGSPASLLALVPTQDRSSKINDISEMGFMDEEMQVLGLVNGLRPIEEIVFLSGQEPTTVYRALMAGVVIGFLAVAVKGVRAEAGGLSDSLQRELEISRRRIEAKYEQVSRSSYFEIMGISKDATVYEIETAYQRLLREFHPVRMSHQQLSDLSEKLNAIRQALDEAYEVLADDLLRERYRQSLS